MKIITPNLLTMLRFFMAIAVPILLFQERTLNHPWFSIFIFTLAIITDWYDGHLARTKNLVSAFGKIADPIADKFLILGVFFSFACLGIYSVFWVIPILIREVVVTVTRLVLLRKGEVIPAEKAGKYKVGIQVGSIYISFLSLILARYFDHLTSVLQVVNYAGIFFANVITIYSGILFFAALSRETKEKIAYQIATVFKIGYAKIAPGTWGSLSALPLVILFGMHQFILAAAFLLVSLAAIWAGTVVSSKEKDEDPGIVVIDEVCGMMMTFLWIPLGWQTILAGFVLFRLFDIWKPFPISLIERKFHKGYGIVLDDVFAGVYANIILQLLIHYAPL